MGGRTWIPPPATASLKSLLGNGLQIFSSISFAPRSSPLGRPLMESITCGFNAQIWSVFVWVRVWLAMIGLSPLPDSWNDVRTVNRGYFKQILASKDRHKKLSSLCQLSIIAYVRALTNKRTHTQRRDRFYTLDRWRGREKSFQSSPDIQSSPGLRY